MIIQVSTVHVHRIVSTCTPIKSTTATPINQFDVSANTFDVAGPLYLRDSTIPPPPIRQPPHPPINEYEISFEEEIISNEANKMYLSQLENELEKQKLVISQLLNELENQKQMALLYYNKHMSLLNINKILLWSSKDVYNWINSLEKGLFIKYKEYLMYSINDEKKTSVSTRSVSLIRMKSKGPVTLLSPNVASLFLPIIANNSNLIIGNNINGMWCCVSVLGFILYIFIYCQIALFLM